MGYSVHLQRLLGILTFGIYPYLIEGYTDHTLQGSHLRSIVFASCETILFWSFFGLLCAHGVDAHH